MVEEYAVMLYKEKELHNIPKPDIQFTIADQLFLHVLLMKIGQKQLVVVQWRTRNIHVLEQEQQLEESIKSLEKKTGRTDNANKTLADLKIKLVESRNKIMMGVLAATCSSQMDAGGEKVSKYFCCLEKN